MNYDAIIIGAGTNGLTTATYFAKKGLKVLCLEKNSAVGGLSSRREFYPGYCSTGVLQDTANLSQKVVKDLELQKHGLAYSDHEDGTLVLSSSEVPFFLHNSAERAKAEISKVSEKDAAAYVEFREFLKKSNRFISDVVDKPLPDMTNFNIGNLWKAGKKAAHLRLMGKKSMMELLRLAPRCLADSLGEWFENDTLKSAIALHAIKGTYLGPWSPSSTANLFLREARLSRQVKGGPAAVSEALRKSAISHGVKIMTESGVKEIELENNKISAVNTHDGKRYTAKYVVSSVDPKTTFNKFFDPRKLKTKFMDRVDHYRMRGTTARIDFALSAKPTIKNWGDQPVNQAVLVDGIDNLERSFDPVKYGEIPTKPALNIHFPSTDDDTLAPAGGAVVSVKVNFCARNIEGDWTEANKKELYETVKSALSEHIESFEETIVGHHVLSPKDIEQNYHVWGGHIHHGEHMLDQFMARPTPECANYHSPIEGMYLCGSGTFPGGGLTCSPGQLAASEILR
jgi:phytoene dehydrogenase-like protein